MYFLGRNAVSDRLFRAYLRAELWTCYRRPVTAAKLRGRCRTAKSRKILFFLGSDITWNRLQGLKKAGGNDYGFCHSGGRIP